MRSSAGFTLIEVMIVIIIIVIITAVLMPNYQRAIEKTKVSEALLVTRAIADANRMYNLKNAQYTSKLEDLDVQLQGKEDILNPDNTESRLFSYAASLSGRENAIAFADRLPEHSFYSLVILSDKNGVGCIYYSDRGHEFCKTLGQDYYIID